MLRVRDILQDDECSGLTQEATSQQQHTDSAHARREAVKAPSVPGDVLRTRPAGVRRKGRRAAGKHGRAATFCQMMIVAV